MCFFLTIVGSETTAKRLRAALPKELRLDEQRNAALQSAAGGRLWALTSGGCSCDLYRVNPVKRRKVGKKGWSEAKLRRAQRQPAEAHRSDFVGLREDVRALLAAAAPLSFFVHAYSGDIDDEPFPLERGERTTDVKPDHLYEL